MDKYKTNPYKGTMLKVKVNFDFWKILIW